MIFDNCLTEINENILLENFDAIELERKYLETLKAEDKKKSGIFYTPNAIVELMVKSVLDCYEVIDYPNLKIIDPSCGTGNFLAYTLVELTKRIYESVNTHETYQLKSYQDIINHVANNLYGIDTDPTALSICCFKLSRLVGPHYNFKNARLMDALKNKEESKYDIVITNPPFKSFGLRNNKKLNNEYDEFLRENYKNSAQYKISYYSLFFELGFNLLKDKGHLSLITPESYLVGRYFSKVRTLIYEGFGNLNFIFLNKNKFSGITFGTPVISLFQKSSDETLVKVQKYNNNTYKYSKKDLTRGRFKRFRIFFDDKSQEIIKKIDETAKSSLVAFYKGFTGVRSKTSKDEIISKAKRGETWKKGLTKGSQVERYKILYDFEWINIDGDSLYKGGWDKTIINNPKVLVRQTGDTLIAALDTEGYYHLNILHTFAKLGGPSLEYLVYYFNSDIINFYYKAISLEEGKSLAQLDIDLLEELPFVYCKNLDASIQEFTKKIGWEKTATIFEKELTDLIGIKI
jgi:hypothetical protein